jgi:hypothetical protein
MSDTCPTVKVKDKRKEGDYMIINESDFVKGEHELFVEKKKTKAKGSEPDKESDTETKTAGSAPPKPQPTTII